MSAARLAVPDVGLITVSEMLDQRRAICQAVSIPVIGDGDTGHGNPVNVRRTVEQFGRAGFAGVMIEVDLTQTPRLNPFLIRATFQRARR